MLDWDSIYISGRDFGELPISIINQIVSYDSSVKPRASLDIGCGAGATARALTEQGYESFGVDSSKEAVRLAALQGQGTFVVFDIESDDDISELAGPFSLIVCKHVYAFIVDKQAFLQRVQGLLVDGGVFALITPLKENVSTKQQKIAVDGGVLAEELRTLFVIEHEEDLKSGRLLVLKKSSADTM